MAAQMDPEDQGLVPLGKSLVTRLFDTVARIFSGIQYKVDEETDFLLEKLAQNNSAVFPYLTDLTHLTLRELSEIKTCKGFTLNDGLRRAILNKDKAGIIAGDEECFVLFQDVFDPLIKEIHEISSHHSPTSSLKPDALNGAVFDGRCVLSCRIRFLRSLKGFPFSWFCTTEERLSVEMIMVDVLEKLQGDLHGEYTPLNKLPDKNLNKMLQSHHIFLKQKCSLNQAWKEGRGIWHDRTNKFLILLNEEEHIKVISHQSGDDLFHVFEKFGALLLEIESLVMRNGHEFIRTSNYGYLASRIQELGNSLRVSVNVDLPLIAKDTRLQFILKCLGLQRRKSGIHFPNVERRRGRIFEVSSTGKIGLSEVDLIEQLVTGVNHLTQMEELLANSHHLDSFISKIVQNTQNVKNERTD